MRRSTDITDTYMQNITYTEFMDGWMKTTVSILPSIHTTKYP